jgi:hypothetical protein
MGKKAKSTVELEVYQVEGFDVLFVDGNADAGRYVDPYPYNKAANHSWTVKKWRTTRWEPNYPDFDVAVLDADGTPVHGKMLLSTVRATYEEPEALDDEDSSGPIESEATFASQNKVSVRS